MAWLEEEIVGTAVFKEKNRVLCCIFVEIIQIYTFRKMACVLESLKGLQCIRIPWFPSRQSFNLLLPLCTSQCEWPMAPYLIWASLEPKYECCLFYFIFKNDDHPRPSWSDFLTHSATTCQHLHYLALPNKDPNAVFVFSWRSSVRKSVYKEAPSVDTCP